MEQDLEVQMDRRRFGGKRTESGFRGSLEERRAESR